MTYKLIEAPIELTDDQLDMVAAAGGSLIDVDIDDVDIDVDVDVDLGGDGKKGHH